MVSRRHAKISVEGGEIFLEDLGSTNGSFVNGEKITRTKLAEGDRILIGTSIIKVVASDGSASVQDAKAKMDAAASSARPSAVSTMTGSIAEVPLPDLLQCLLRLSQTVSIDTDNQVDINCTSHGAMQGYGITPYYRIFDSMAGKGVDQFLKKHL